MSRTGSPKRVAANKGRVALPAAASVASTLVVALSFSWVALINGYPLVFPDSGRYIDGGIRHFIPAEGPIFYGIFMIPLHMNGISLWPAVLAQCLILAHLLRLTLRVLDVLGEPTYVAVSLFLAVFSSLPWFAAFIMPDVFTSVAVLSLFVLYWGWDRLGRLERSYIVVLAVGALAFHISHVLLGLCLSLVFVLMTLIERHGRNAVSLLVPALPLVALCAILGMNLIAKGRPIISENGNVFLFARVFADGPALDYMRDHCPERQWNLCRVYERLPKDVAGILWDKDRTIWSAAPAPTVRAEAGDIAAGAMLSHPAEMLRAAAANSWRQLLTFSAGSDFGNNSNADDYINLVLHRFFPSEEGQFLASWQQRGAPDLAAINFIYALVVVASLVGTVVILAISGFPAGLTEFSLVVAVGIVANAFVTGALSGVYDRYQARIIWLVPFVFATSVAVSLRRQLPAHQASAG